MSEINIPAVGESIVEVTIGQLLKKTGDVVQADEVICEIESDKATFEIRSESRGILSILVEEGDTVKIGANIGSVDDSDAGNISSDAKSSTNNLENTTTKNSKIEISSKEPSDYALKHPSPAAEKILLENRIPASKVKSTGIKGRITKEDALNSILTTPKKGDVTIGDVGNRSTKRKKMSSLRKTIAKRLVAVKNQTAMLTTFNEVDMSAVMKLRKHYKQSFK